MRIRAAIALADAASVLKEFAVGDHDRALHMLGLGVEREAPTLPKPQPVDVVRSKAGERPIDLGPGEPPAAPSARTSITNDVLVLREAAVRSAPSWFAAASPLPLESNVDLPPPVLDPLFTPAWQRSIAVTALSGTVASGEIDVEHVIDRFASGEPVERLPLLSRRSLQAGAQIVLDLNEAMRPFFGDQEQTVAVVRALFAPERLTVVLCDDGPPAFRGGGTETYEPPPPGATVLILSNFGIATGRDAVVGGETALWRAFAGELRRRGHTVLAFAPMDLHRLSASFRRALPVVPWDRATGAGSIVRARARAEVAG